MRAHVNAILYFNPRTPVGCDQWTKPDTTLQTISIHAPQWGATSRRCPCSHRRNDFNPRTPVGCDVQLMLLVKWATKFQSTHPSGVRPGGDREKTISALFQSTHPSGVRPVEYRIGDTVKPFQSTHPSGVRLPSHPCRRTFHVFQSTHPSGVRHGGVRRHTGELYISIHAPQWGATLSAFPRYGLPRISIHAPQWGATMSNYGFPARNVFQSTHPSGVRLAIPCWMYYGTEFQSTHPSGVRPRRRAYCHKISLFQSTHPSGVRPPPSAGP